MSLVALIDEIARAQDKPRALIGELRSRLAERAPDAVTLASAQRALAVHGIALSPSAAVWSPECGSTYLLVVGGGGEAGRLRAFRDGPAHARRLQSRSARAQLNVVFDVLTARLAARGAGIPDAEGRGHHLRTWVPGDYDVGGDSLGVAVAVALTSLWTDQAPRADTASTAAIGADGGLRHVDGLSQKLTALQRRYPAVRRVVVAKTQEGDAPPGIELLPAETIESALSAHGLDLAQVCGRLDSRAARAQIESLHHERVPSYEAEQWRLRAHRARWLAECTTTATLRARALGHAALFHLHAGEAREADDLFESLDDDAVADLPAGVRVSLWINAASGKIDRDPKQAIELAERALEGAEELAGQERADHLGKALGTLGRALVHAQNAERALPHLKAAVHHHETHLPDEQAQSLVHWATGLRHANDLGAALEAAERAVALVQGRAHDPTELFARYERARCYFAREQFDEALMDIAFIESAQASPTDYPRLGTTRYLVAIELSRGAVPRRLLEEACELVERLHPPLSALAAGAIAEALVSPVELPGDLHARLMGMWGAWGRDCPPEIFLEKLVY